MALEIVVFTGSSNEQVNLPNGTPVFHETLGAGNQAEKISVQMEELLNSVLNQVQKSVKTECEVQISIAGKVSLVGQGSAKLLIFNVGGQSAKETTMTITLKSKVLPN